MFEHEFLTVLDEEEGLAHNVFKLLDALALHELFVPTIKYLIEFEAFYLNSQGPCPSSNTDFHIKANINEVRLEWDFSEACEKKLSDFEAKKQERLRQQQAFDQQILDYQAQIVEINKKITEVEWQKTSLDTAKALPTQDVVNHEVLKGISHGEKALKIEASIKLLWGRESLLDSRIGHETTFFEDFKLDFPLDFSFL